ncbi:MAG: lipoate--protein ligase family protein [Planctomycetes bacterium]|nr:lipoate--protein ligase family protein [Planctomycetota bacterium]MCG2682770.1 lipoate--protein ligase family protein [Planctomycetales bacterium]
MAVDEALLEAAATEGRPTLRFYQWQEPTLSLGYFQEYEDRRRHAASAGCPTVRRTSGGGAILHDRELTYSLAVPEGHPLVADRLRTYRVIHESLIDALSGWGIEATLYTCGMAAADRASIRPQPGSAVPQCTEEPQPGRQPFLCFQRRSLGDVLAGGVKIAGSAQHRRRGAVLQHGSVLLARSAAAPELDGLKDRTDKSIAVDKLIEAWLERLAEVLAVEWRISALSGDDRRRATALDSEKYSTAAWTKNRGRR